MIIIQIILTGLTYFLFSNEFFSFLAEIKDEKISRFSRFLNFLIVYIWFMVASMLELPLVVNWSVFLIILGIQVYKAFSFKLDESYALSSFCIILGLAVNVFCRSLMAIVINKPLNVFDNSLSGLKTYPIALGFLVAVILFHILRRKNFPAQLNLMMNDQKSFKFYFATEIFIFIFLSVQLLTYSQSSNEMGVKMWGIKSAIFSGFVLVVTIIYSLHVASLNFYMKKQYENRDQLIQDKKDVNKLWSLAYTDMLTGCSNRQLLDKRIVEYTRYGRDITLAFVDLNGLKKVNDQYGHIEGDTYLKTVSNTLVELTKSRNIDLYRYGGDEFILMSDTLKEQELDDILNRAAHMLKEVSAKYPYSICYGVVHGEASDYKGLIDTADEIMYSYKKKYYKKEMRN